MGGFDELKPLVGAMDRRAFLRIGGGFGLGGLLAACGGGGGSSSSPDGGATNGGGSNGGSSSPTPVPQIALPAPTQTYSVLKRTSFGVHKDALAAMQSNGVQAYLEAQLAYENINDSALDRLISSRFSSVGTPVALLRPFFPGNRVTLTNDLVGATLFRAVFSQRQLYEIMVEFWGNHFSIDIRNGLEPLLKPVDDREVIRPNAMTSFRQLLLASARSPAMQFSLDNFLNTKTAPNENYARELLELHTLGIDGGYTEQDVKEVARCFTGWGISSSYIAYQYTASAHDTGQKIVLGQVIPAGGQEQDGLTVLNMLAGSSATANHIAKKLCRRFISDNPPSAVVAQVAQTFRDTDGDIRSMLRTIFKSSAFLDARDGKIDRPIEFVAQIVRALNPQLTIPGDRGEGYGSLINLLGQLPFQWLAPDGYPDTAEHWASTSGFLNRWRIALIASTGGGFNLNAFVGGANTVAGVADALVAAILRRSLASDDRTALVNWLAGLAAVASTTPLSPSTINAIVPPAVAMLLSSAYFQLR